jgi:chemotaxis protein CheX
MIPPNTALAPALESEHWTVLLQQAAQEVFELMLGTNLTATFEPVSEEALNVTSMVGLAGQLCGVVSVRCSTKSAAHMAAKMLGLETDKPGPEMWDAVGEVCNMVAGNFKNKISGMGDKCMLSVPTVISGADYSMHSMADSGALRATFLFEKDAIIFTLEIHS